MQALGMTHLIEVYRIPEMHRRAEEERRIRRFLAQSSVSAQRSPSVAGRVAGQVAGRMAGRLDAMRSFISRHTSTGNILRGSAADRPQFRPQPRSRRGAA